MNRICERYSGLIEDLVDGEELGEQAAAQTESHIFDCAECRHEYELRRREKEIFAHYLFDFEPQPDSWINFQTRLAEEPGKTPGDTVVADDAPRRRKRIFALSFSPALAAFAGLLLFFGIGFVWLRNAAFEKNDDNYAAETKSAAPESPERQPGETNQKPATESAAKNIADSIDNSPKNNESPVNDRLLKARNNFLFSKRFRALETVKIKQKSAALSERKKSANETLANDETRAAALRKQNLENEIAGQIEKVEMLLRSFRNAPANEAVEGFDVEYEKGQARKLLVKNAKLRRDTEDYSISYAEELLSRVEPYLLDIANLENKPSADKVLDIKKRVISQNIIASLQVYSAVAAR
jgi:hypothetical protein